MESRNAQGQVVNREFKERHIIKANKAGGVEIFEDEKHLVHLLMRKKEHDPVNKKYVDFDSVQSFSLVDYNNMVTSGFFANYDTVEVLHMPDGAKQTAQPAAGPAQATEADKAAAAKEMSELREHYAALYGTPAAADASIGDLKALIDVKNSQLAAAAKTDADAADDDVVTTEDEARVKKELESYTVAQLKEKYTDLTGKTAENDWRKDDLVTAVYLAGLEYHAKHSVKP